jgi:hypothetical protein
MWCSTPEATDLWIVSPVELGLKRNNVLCEQKGIGVGIVREEG